MSALRFPFIVNQARLRADLELGDQATVAARRRYGVHLQYLGYIEHDDAVRALLAKAAAASPREPGQSGPAATSRRSRAGCSPSHDSPPRAARPGATCLQSSHHDVLEVERGATDEEIRRAYKRMCSGLRPGEPRHLRPCSIAEGLEAARSSDRRGLRRAPRPCPAPSLRDIRLPGGHRRTEVGNGGRAHRSRPPSCPQRRASRRTPSSAEPCSAPSASRRARASSQISERTKVGTSYLACIEEEDYEQLPAAVYVRGFVTEFAKCLRLDPEQVTQSYMRRYKARMEPGEEGA